MPTRTPLNNSLKTPIGDPVKTLSDTLLEILYLLRQVAGEALEIMGLLPA